MQKKDKSHAKQNGESHREIKAVEVTFVLENAKAEEVYLCGDFNDWSPNGARMIHQAERGLWVKRLALPPGRYEYKFIVDGEWTADPEAPHRVVNNYGSINSIVEVRR